MKRLVVALSMLTMMSLFAGAVFSAGENIAKGCGVSFNSSPSYGAGQRLPAALTDGVYASTGQWRDNGVIGWETKRPITITVDLGKVQPVSGVGFSSMCDNSEWVQWAGSIMIYTSTDSETWFYAGDLISLSRKNGTPPLKGSAKYKFATDELRAQGRFVRLVVFPRMECVFTDEVEVYGGGEVLPAALTSDKGVKDTSADSSARYFDSRVRFRLSADLDAVRGAVAKSKLSEPEKRMLTTRLDGLAKRIPAVHEVNTPAFRAILPIDREDAEIFAIYGSLLKASGLPGLFAWKVNPYDLISPTDVPQRKPAKVGVSVSMLRNEYRKDAFLLTNASGAARDVRLTVEGLPGGARPEWLSVYAIPWTDTTMGVPVQAALVPAKFADGAFSFSIPAGLTAKVWLTVDSSKLASGRYGGKIVAKAGGASVSVPLNVYVSKVSMARPRLSFTEWDYTFVPGIYAVTPGNIAAAVELMRSHFVDSPWARPTDVVLPDADAFDAQGNLVKPLAFGAFDTWLARWKDARHFLIFLNAPTSIAGCEMGTKEFDVRAGQWAKALGEHMKAAGLKPEQVGIMIKDEPNPSDLKIILAWAKPIREAIPGIKIFQDCNNYQAYKTDNEIQAHHLADISCPEIGPFYSGGEENRKFFTGLLSESHENWFYQCYGPLRSMDPYQYNRLEAWHCFKHGSTGMGLWAFGDTGAFPDSWNEYSYAGPSYSPVFFKGDELFSGVHYEGCREGIEDYEYLSMLRDAAKGSSDAGFRAEAEALIAESLDSVLGGGYVSDAKQWSWSKDRSKADLCRLAVLRMLEEADR